MVKTYEEYQRYVSNQLDKEKQPMCISGVDKKGLCNDNCKTYKQFDGKCKKVNGCYCRKTITSSWRSYEEVKNHGERGKCINLNCDSTVCI